MNNKKLIKTKNNINRGSIFSALLVFILVIATSLLFAGCSGSNGKPANGSASASPSSGTEVKNTSEFFFEYKDVKIAMDDDVAPILKTLGEAQNYFEAKSCAFDGMDKVYTYGGIELRAYAGEGFERVWSVSFMDDSVSTREGIAIGDKFEKVVEKYGDKYEKSTNLYSYSNGNCKLSFSIQNDEVASVEYSLILNK